MKKYYKFRLFPSKIQAKRLHQEMFVAKQIYDILLSFYKNPQTRDLIFEYEIEKEIKKILDARKLTINSKVLQQEVRSFRTLICSRTKLRQNGIEVGELKFKKYRETDNHSFKTCGKEQYSVKRKNEKIGIIQLFRMSIPFVFSRELPSIPKTLIISYDGIDFYASFAVEVSVLGEINGLRINQTYNEDNALGMDLNNNSVDFGTLGTHFKYKVKELKNIEKSMDKLERLGRKLSKSRERAKYIAKKIEKENAKKFGKEAQIEKVVESENYKKLRRKFKKLHRKVSRQREARVMDIRSYFIKVMIENNLNQVAVEDMSVVKLTSKDNIIVKIGTKKSMKMRKNILSIGYGMIRTAIENACVHYGWRFHKVETKYSSKQCSCCGHIKYDLKVEDREYICENDSCGFVIARDYNSCRNLIQRIPR